MFSNKPAEVLFYFQVVDTTSNMAFAPFIILCCGTFLVSLLLPLVCISKIFFKGPCLLSALIWLVMTLIVNIYMSVLPNRTVDNDLPVVFYIIIVLYTMLPLPVLWSLFFGFLSTLLQMLIAGIFTSENKENLVFQVRSHTVFILIRPKEKIGMQLLSGRVLDSRPKGCGFDPHRHNCVVVLEQDTFILA